jgi:tetratricopeptide (TPR) repeat protein
MMGATMRRNKIRLSIPGIVAFFAVACSQATAPRDKAWDLHKVVAPVQRSVVTVAAMGVEGDVLRIGSGFFIARDGTLVTSDHVLDGALEAKVKTAEGGIFPINAVIAHSPLADLVKVRVQIPPELSAPAALADRKPAIADRVVVIGSPMGLSQTISEGIIAAVRRHASFGEVYQLTAPTSPGSSGGPVLNLKGQVIGVVSFQTTLGQNINFAVAINALQMMSPATGEPSIAEWTLGNAARDPGQAATLCRQGAQLSIKGEYKAALDYFRQAAVANPEDPHAWSGLGSCYIGLNQPSRAIEALNRSVAAAPDDASGHFMLAMYFKDLGQYGQQVDSLSRVIGIDPENIKARMELAGAYDRLGKTEAQLETYRGILEIKPDHVPALQRMGQSLGRIGRYDEALDMLHRAGALAPDNAEIYYDMGAIYNSRNLPAEELKAYVQAIRVDPQMVGPHYGIALLFLRQGNRELALQEYAILKNLDEDMAQRLFKIIYPHSIDNIKTKKSRK